jgi:hypothetical protein
VFFFVIGNIINIPFLFFFFRGHFLDLDFGLGYGGKLGEGFFFSLGTSLMFLFLFFSLGMLDFGLGYEGKLGKYFFFVTGNVINIPFSFFSLGNTFWNWILAWVMRECLLYPGLWFGF